MTFKDNVYTFDTNKVTNIWCTINEERSLCNHKQISVLIRKPNGRKEMHNFVARIKVICTLERISDYLDYINQFVLIPDYDRSNAFNFIELLNCEYVIVHCIQELAKTFAVDHRNITDAKDCFAYFQYGNGNDGNIFEYIRSLCAVHPAETSMQSEIHGFENFNSCSRIVWDHGFEYDERDLTAVIYSADKDGEEMYLGIQVEPLMMYLKKWVDLLDDIVQGIRIYIENEKKDYRTKMIANPEDFDNYLDYIDNLCMEYKCRYSESQIELFEKYKLAFTIYFDDAETERKRECYQNAVKYMFECLHKQLQGMNDRENTGLVGLGENETNNLFFALYQPIEHGSMFSNHRLAFPYVDNLCSSVYWDVRHARQVLDEIKPMVNEYVKFENTESPEKTELLLQIATYFDALAHDGYINRSIPNREEFR